MEKNKAIPDMRSITETAERFRLPVHFVRQLVLDKKIVAVQAGSRKYLVNQESLALYLNGMDAQSVGSGTEVVHHEPRG